MALVLPVLEMPALWRVFQIVSMSEGCNDDQGRVLPQDLLAPSCSRTPPIMLATVSRGSGSVRIEQRCWDSVRSQAAVRDACSMRSSLQSEVGYVDSTLVLRYITHGVVCGLRSVRLSAVQERKLRWAMQAVYGQSCSQRQASSQSLGCSRCLSLTKLWRSG